MFRPQPLLFALTIILISAISILFYKEESSSTPPVAIISKTKNLGSHAHLNNLVAQAAKEDYLAKTIAVSFQRTEGALIFPFTREVGPTYTIVASSEEKAINKNASASPMPYESQTFSINSSLQKGSQFLCPEDLPYAIDFSLESDVTKMVVFGQRYANKCAFDSGGKIYDLLYGAIQNPQAWGDAENLTAFIPKYLYFGCHNQLNNVMVPIQISESAINVAPIIGLVNNKQVAIGYQETSNVSIDCKMVCNSLLKESCKTDQSYCQEQISAAYQRQSVYQLRAINEYFCACQIYNPNWEKGYQYFTNAVDIENAIKYNNPLQTVTCSNFPPPIN